MHSYSTNILSIFHSSFIFSSIFFVISCTVRYTLMSSVATIIRIIISLLIFNVHTMKRPPLLYKSCVVLFCGCVVVKNYILVVDHRAKKGKRPPLKKWRKEGGAGGDYIFLCCRFFALLLIAFQEGWGNQNQSGYCQDRRGCCTFHKPTYA
jgi:hypothetical protein